jgi:hypothetical protein
MSVSDWIPVLILTLVAGAEAVRQGKTFGRYLRAARCRHHRVRN